MSAIQSISTLERGKPTRYGHVFRPDEAWLARAEPEPVLEPDLAIVDAHHHLWDLPGSRYLLPEFAADLASGHNVAATVYVECLAMYRARGPSHLRPLGEVEFAAGMAAMSDSGNYGSTRACASIVGAADLALGARVAEVLEAEIDAGAGRLRGVRCRAGWDADPEIAGGRGTPGVYLQPEVQEGVRCLGSYGLSMDAHLLHPQLPELARLAQVCPDTEMILCHTGVPLGYGSYAGRSDEVFADWKAGLMAVAACPNVSVKLGGMIVRRSEYDFGRSERPITSEALANLWRPYLLTCVELFGPDRCMVESNFPVDKIGIGYAALWNTLKRVFADFAPDEKRAIFSGTATRVYWPQLD